MSADDNAESKLKRWLQTLLVVAAIGVLIMVMLQKGWVGDDWGWRQAEREVLLKRFNESLLLAKTEWLRRGNPQFIVLKTREGQSSIQMNQRGWPSIDNGCQQLWRMLAGGRDLVVASQQQNGCLYRFNQDNNGAEFQLIYNSSIGQIN